MSNISAGSYTLEVRGSNRHGSWGSKPLEIKLKVMPRWHETYWFKLLLLSLIILCLWGLYVLRVKQLKARQKVLEETVDLRTSELKNSLRELEATKDQLVESEKQASLGRLIRGVSHELNTPIGILKSSCSGLLEESTSANENFESGSMTEEGLRKVLAISKQSSALMAKNIERMAQLTSRFKQSSAEDTSGSVLQFSVLTIIKAVQGEVQKRLSESNVEMFISCDESLCITTDQQAFQNALTEIVQNCIDHGLDGAESVAKKKITIKAQQWQGDGVKLLIVDNGKGMEAAVLKEIFEPFYTQSSRTEHVGLGLHSVFNWVVQLLHGTIKCRAVVGRGTAVVLKIKNRPL